MKLFFLLGLAVAVIYFFKKSKQPLSKKIIYLNFVFLIMSLPLAFFVGLFFLSSLNSERAYAFWMVGGFLAYALFSVLSLRWIKFWPGIVVSAFAFYFGVHLDKQYWKAESKNSCIELRQDPYCIEGESRFSCHPNSKNFSVAKIGCDAMDDELRMESNLLKKQQASKDNIRLIDEEVLTLGINAYEKILTSILASNAPESLNFEPQLVGIYNCLNSEYNDALKAETMALSILSRNAVTESQRQAYRAYLASKGRMVASDRVVPALPAGDVKYNCEEVRRFLKP
ncbi:hypothetical protein BDW_08475 [Bdellovibrio bacteriovorus W]|nr:hypothetical protein BDW_08475 [Bdellovibrio bacteriovorus W]